MEYRWNLRMPIHADVVVENAQLGTLRGTTRDLSFEGTYVETKEQPVPLLSNTFAEVRFSVGDGERRQRFSVPSVVVRTGKDGIGLMFCDFDEAGFEGLATLLHRHLDAQARTAARA